MKANELRIGNYYNQFGNIHQATGTTISELEKAPKDQLWCKPIPLTEDWLLKFGFKLNKLGNMYRYSNYPKRVISFKKFQGKWYLYMTHNPKCDYVHQLQNLYFALTGEELTLSQ